MYDIPSDQRMVRTVARLGQNDFDDPWDTLAIKGTMVGLGFPPGWFNSPVLEPKFNETRASICEYVDVIQEDTRAAYFTKIAALNQG